MPKTSCLSTTPRKMENPRLRGQTALHTQGLIPSSQSLLGGSFQGKGQIDMSPPGILDSP